MNLRLLPNTAALGVALTVAIAGAAPVTAAPSGPRATVGTNCDRGFAITLTANRTIPAGATWWVSTTDPIANRYTGTVSPQGRVSSLDVSPRDNRADVLEVTTTRALTSGSTLTIRPTGFRQQPAGGKLGRMVVSDRSHPNDNGYTIAWGTIDGVNYGPC